MLDFTVTGAAACRTWLSVGCFDPVTDANCSTVTSDMCFPGGDSCVADLQRQAAQDIRQPASAPDVCSEDPNTGNEDTKCLYYYFYAKVDQIAFGRSEYYACFRFEAGREMRIFATGAISVPQDGSGTNSWCEAAIKSGWIR